MIKPNKFSLWALIKRREREKIACRWYTRVSQIVFWNFSLPMGSTITNYVIPHMQQEKIIIIT